MEHLNEETLGELLGIFQIWFDRSNSPLQLVFEDVILFISSIKKFNDQNNIQLIINLLNTFISLTKNNHSISIVLAYKTFDTLGKLGYKKLLPPYENKKIPVKGNHVRYDRLPLKSITQTEENQILEYLMRLDEWLLVPENISKKRSLDQSLLHRVASGLMK